MFRFVILLCFLSFPRFFSVTRSVPLTGVEAPQNARTKWRTCVEGLGGVGEQVVGGMGRGGIGALRIEWRSRTGSSQKAPAAQARGGSGSVSPPAPLPVADFTGNPVQLGEDPTHR